MFFCIMAIVAIASGVGSWPTSCVGQEGGGRNRSLSTSSQMSSGCETFERRERLAALDRIAVISARYGEYQRKTDREIPIVRLTREA